MLVLLLLLGRNLCLSLSRWQAYPRNGPGTWNAAAAADSDHIASRTRERRLWREEIAERATVDAADAADMAQYATMEDAIYGEYARMEREGFDAAEIRQLRAEKPGVKQLR